MIQIRGEVVTPGLHPAGHLSLVFTHNKPKNHKSKKPAKVTLQLMKNYHSGLPSPEFLYCITKQFTSNYDFLVNIFIGSNFANF